MKDKKYLIVSRKFPEISAASCPLVGQIATNSKILAYILYWYLNRFSYKCVSKYDTYMIAVELLEKKAWGYEIIKR